MPNEPQAECGDEWVSRERRRQSRRFFYDEPMRARPYNCPHDNELALKLRRPRGGLFVFVTPGKDLRCSPASM
jgi:hypothetical protein